MTEPSSLLAKLVCVAGACAVLLAAAGCAPKAPVVRHSAPDRLVTSDKSGRESIALTVYNQNFGVVRETRRLALGKGKLELSFRDVSAHLQPETVRVQGLSGDDALRLLEQNYRYDLLTPAKLLEKYVGKRIAVYRYNEKTGVEERKQAEVLSVAGGVTLRIDGEVTTNFQGRYGFEALPPNLLDQPTLVWLLESDLAEQRVEVTYLTQNLNWRADYVLTLDASDQKADLNGWVTLSNQSGASYENAALRLVAGDVNRAQPIPPDEPPMDAMRDLAVSRPQSFEQESLFEYHLYSLERPTSILDKETKQVSLLQAAGVALRKKLIFQGAQYYFRSRTGQLATNQKVGAYLELVNSERNGLGMPLPKGTLRVYKADAGGALQFVGEDAIDHTPRDEELRVKLGEAFDVVGDRTQTRWTQVSKCVADSAYEIELRNHKDRSEQVEVNEPVGADWEILASSHAAQKPDSATLRFDVAVPARGKTRLSYQIRVRYC